MQPWAGYREISHTADWKLEVWGSSLPALLEEAARGMYALAEVRIKDAPRQTRHLNFLLMDPERVLVNFLTELLLFIEMDGLVMDQFSWHIQADQLEVDLSGRPLSGLDKEIKAVTYHNLSIEVVAEGLKTQIVFDV